MAVVQAVLMFGSNKWVLTPRLEKALTGFHHQSKWRMTGMGPRRWPDGMWVYPPIGAALAIVGLGEIGIYIARRHNMVAQYIATHPIIELCLEAEWKPGLRLSRRWWEQPAVYIMGIGVVQVAAEGREDIGGGKNRNWSCRERESRGGADDRDRMIW